MTKSRESKVVGRWLTYLCKECWKSLRVQPVFADRGEAPHRPEPLLSDSISVASAESVGSAPANQKKYLLLREALPPTYERPMYGAGVRTFAEQFRIFSAGDKV